MTEFYVYRIVGDGPARAEVEKQLETLDTRANAEPAWRDYGQVIMADDYDDSATEWLVRAQQVVLEISRPRPEDRVLDLGTGTGALALGLSPKVKEILAVDISPKMLEKVDARQLPNVRTLLASFDDFAEKFGGKADLVVSNYALHHLDGEEKSRALASIASVLSPGGRFVLGDKK